MEISKSLAAEVKEMVVDFSKGKRNFPLLVIDNIRVERVILPEF